MTSSGGVDRAIGRLIRDAALSEEVQSASHSYLLQLTANSGTIEKPVYFSTPYNGRHLTAHGEITDAMKEEMAYIIIYARLVNQTPEDFIVDSVEYARTYNIPSEYVVPDDVRFTTLQRMPSARRQDDTPSINSDHNTSSEGPHHIHVQKKELMDEPSALKRKTEVPEANPIRATFDPVGESPEIPIEEKTKDLSVSDEKADEYGQENAPAPVQHLHNQVSKETKQSSTASHHKPARMSSGLYSFAANYFISATHTPTFPQDEFVGCMKFNVNCDMTSIDIECSRKIVKNVFLRHDRPDEDYETAPYVMSLPEPSPFPQDPVYHVAASINWQAFRGVEVMLVDLISAEHLQQPHQPRADAITTMFGEPFEVPKLMPYYLALIFDPDMVCGEHIDVNVPSWAEAWVQQLKSGRVHLLIWADAQFLHWFTTITEILEWQLNQTVKIDGVSYHRYDPLRVWHNGAGAMVFKPTHMNPNHGLDNPHHRYIERCCFHSFEHYATVWSIALMHEQQAQETATTQYAKETKVLKLLETARWGTTKMLGFLERPDLDTSDGEIMPRLGHGDRLRLSFDLDKPHFESTEWSAEVLHSAPFAPYQYIPLLVTRSMTKSSQKERPGVWTAHVKFGQIKVSTLEAGRYNGHDLTAAIISNSGNRVKVQIVTSDQVYRQNMKSLDAIYNPPKGKQVTAWGQNAQTILSAQNLSQLPVNDGWACITEEYSHFWDRLDPINQEQRDAYVALTQCLGRIGIIDGPPGTGKTHFYQKVLQLLFTLERKHLAVVMTSANELVDRIAIDLEAMMEEGKRQGIVPRERYGLRVHSRGTEKTIELSFADKSMSERPNHERTIPRNVVTDELDLTNQLIESHILNTEARPYRGVSDRRVKVLQMSVGVMMLKVSGVLPSDEYNKSSKGRWDEFKTLYKVFSQGADMTDQQSRDWEKESSKLYRYVISQASFIVGTTTGLATAAVLQPIAEEARLLIHDEAMREPEANMLPFFNAAFPKLDMLLEIGDWRQFSPRPQTTGFNAVHFTSQQASRSSENANVNVATFASQWKMALPTRLAKVGMPVNHFYEQHRMVPSICKVVNDLNYEGRLEDAPSTAVETRNIAMAFGSFVYAFNKKTSGKDGRSNVLLLDFQGGAVDTSIGANQSKYNEAYITWIGNSLPSIMKQFPSDMSVAVLTPYVEERNRLRSVHTAMLLGGVESSVMDRLEITTIDASQGKEWDVVIVLMTTSDKVGHTGDRVRLSVALSRAKNGLICLANQDRVNSGKRGGWKTLCKALQLCREVTVKVKMEQLPTCPFYNADQRR